MEHEITKKLFFEDIDLVPEDMGGGVSRQIIAYDEKLMLVKVTFDKGAIGALHQHYHTQISYIEKGAFEVTINEERKLLAAGSSFYVPPNALHGVLCLEPGVLIDMFSPMREDFMQK